MTSLTLSAHGAAAADLAWSRYVELERWPDWSPFIRRVDSSSTRIGSGVTGTVVGPLGLPVRFVVDAVDGAARRWAWHVRSGPVRLRLSHHVVAHPAGCATTLTIKGPLLVVAAYAPAARMALAGLVRPDPADQG